MICTRAFVCVCVIDVWGGGERYVCVGRGGGGDILFLANPMDAEQSS